MGDFPEYIDGLPNLCGSEPRIQAAITAGQEQPVFLGRSSVDMAGIDSAFAVALHMHQPLIPVGGPDLRTAAIIGNLQWMLEQVASGLWCKRATGVGSLEPAKARGRTYTRGTTSIAHRAYR